MGPLFFQGIAVGIVNRIAGRRWRLPHHSCTGVIWQAAHEAGAVGSSLTIMAFSSLFGFFSTSGQYEINWVQLLMLHCHCSERHLHRHQISTTGSPAQASKGFGWFVLAMGAYVLSKELFRW